MPADLDRLARTLDAFPASVRVAVEPRHPSWFTEALRTHLSERGVALCLADRRGPLMPSWATADWAYLRFHGGRGRPASCYGESALASWTQRVLDGWGTSVDGYAYFNNDHAGCALRDASVFGASLVGQGVDVARRPKVDDAVLLTPAKTAPRSSAS